MISLRYQATHIMSQSVLKQPLLPSPWCALPKLSLLLYFVTDSSGFPCKWHKNNHHKIISSAPINKYPTPNKACTQEKCLQCSQVPEIQKLWSSVYQSRVPSVQSLNRVWLSVTPWITAHQASLSITNSRNSLRLTSIKSVMPSSHLILCCPLLLLPPIPPSIRVFSNESTLRMRG